MDEFEDASSASSDGDELRVRSRSSSTSSASSEAGVPDADEVVEARSDVSDDELVAREESSSDSEEDAGGDLDDDLHCVARVLHATVHHMQRDRAALRDPAVGAWLAANDYCPPADACALVDGLERMCASNFGAAPSDAELKRGVAGALSGALRDVLRRRVPASELVGAPARVTASERASIEKHAKVALAHHADHGSSVQALYRVLTTDPLVKKLLGTLGGTAKDAHHLAWSLSTRLGKLEAHMTVQTLSKAIQLLISMLFRILIHTLLFSSPDEIHAPVVPGVTVGDLGAAVFVNELHYHLTRPDATYGEEPGPPATMAEFLRKAFNAKFAGARGPDDEVSEEPPSLPDDEPEEESDESDTSELRPAPPAPPRPAAPALPPRPAPAAEAALERLLSGPTDGAAALDPAAAATIATLRRAVDANATEVALAQSNLAQAQAAEAAAEVVAADEAARAKEARRRASNRAAARFLAENAGRALESDATREAARATHAAVGAAHQTAIAEAPRLAGGFASALRGLFGRKGGDAAPKVPASEKLAAAAGKLGAVSGALTAVVDKGGDVLNHAGPVFQAMIGNVANVATILAEMVAKILASPETQKALSGVADVATRAVGGVAEQAVSAIGKGVVESVKEIADSPDGVPDVFADHRYAGGLVHMSKTTVCGLPRAVLYVKEHKKVEVPVSVGVMVGFALARRNVGDLAATTATFVATLYRLVRALLRRPEQWPQAAVDYVRSGVALAPPRDREDAYHGEPVYAIRVPRAVDLSALNASTNVGAWLPSHLLPVLDFLCGAIAAIALTRPDLVSPAQINNLHAEMQRVGARK